MLLSLLIILLASFTDEPRCSEEQQKILSHAQKETGGFIDIYSEGKKCQTIVISYINTDLRPYKHLSQNELKESLYQFISKDQLKELENLGFKYFAIRDKFGTNRVISVK